MRYGHFKNAYALHEQWAVDKLTSASLPTFVDDTLLNFSNYLILCPFNVPLSMTQIDNRGWSPDRNFQKSIDIVAGVWLAMTIHTLISPIFSTLFAKFLLLKSCMVGYHGVFTPNGLNTQRIRPSHRWQTTVSTQ